MANRSNNDDWNKIVNAASKIAKTATKTTATTAKKSGSSSAKTSSAGGKRSGSSSKASSASKKTTSSGGTSGGRTASTNTQQPRPENGGTTPPRGPAAGAAKKNTALIVVVVLLVAVIVAVLIFGYYRGWFDGFFKHNDGKTGGDVQIVANGDLSVHFLYLGNKYTGDCVYIKAGDTDVLIDAGSKNNSANTIVPYLKNYVTDNKLEYVIATHGHEDHVSGFYSTSSVTGVFDSFETETIIDFPRTNSSGGATTVVGRYFAARDNEVAAGATHYTAAQCFHETDGAQKKYQLSADVELEILYNYYYFYDQSDGENDYSVCVMLHQGDNHYLFTGDLEARGERKMVDYYKNTPGETELPQCVLYKAGHHGSKTSSSEELMAAIRPKYVCVCCCCGTSEYTDTDANQFPTQEFVNRVAPYTDKVYVTTMVDNYAEKSKWSSEGTVKLMNGNIVFSCTDGVVTVTCSENDTLLKDTDWFKAHRTMPAAWR